MRLQEDHFVHGICFIFCFISILCAAQTNKSIVSFTKWIMYAVETGEIGNLTELHIAETGITCKEFCSARHIKVSMI